MPQCYRKEGVEAAPTPKAIVSVVAGIVDAFVEENKLTEIEACYSGSEVIETDLAAALKAAEAKDWMGAIAHLKDVAAEIPAALSNCKMGDDISAIKTWAKIFKDETKLEEIITKNLIMHKAKITDDIQTIKTDYTAEKYFDCGKAIGDALILALGPVHLSHPKAAEFL